VAYDEVLGLYYGAREMRSHGEAILFMQALFTDLEI
jgi:hypothetical protein